MVHARPNPGNEHSQIPAEFAGKFTKADYLKRRIVNWLNKEWDMAETPAAQRKAAAKKAPKKSAKEALDEIPAEMKAELGDAIGEVIEEK